jgi:DNA-binding transcriptional ArsR family regulator
MEVADKELEKIFKALANKRRIMMLRFIRRKKEADVSEIAAHTKLSMWATSRHLLKMYSANILDKEQRGPNMFYRLSSSLSAHANKILSAI